MACECWLTPVLPGQEDTAREFATALNGPRRLELVEAEKRLSLTKEAIFLSQGPTGAVLVFYMEGHDVAASAQTSAGSENEFDQWYKTMFTKITGLRIGEPIPPAELLMIYSESEES